MSKQYKCDNCKRDIVPPNDISSVDVKNGQVIYFCSDCRPSGGAVEDQNKPQETTDNSGYDGWLEPPEWRN